MNPRPQDTQFARLFILMSQREIIRRRLARLERQIEIVRKHYGLPPIK